MDKYNDNELIQLIEKGNEEALEIMFSKYELLIRSKVIKFKLDKYGLDDYLQEGRLMLHKAIKKYDLSSSKTFNKYFDLILTNHFLTVVRDIKNDFVIGYLNEEEIEDKQKIPRSKCFGEYVYATDETSSINAFVKVEPDFLLIALTSSFSPISEWYSLSART